MHFGRGWLPGRATGYRHVGGDLQQDGQDQASSTEGDQRMRPSCRPKLPMDLPKGRTRDARSRNASRCVRSVADHRPRTDHRRTARSRIARSLLPAGLPRDMLVLRLCPWSAGNRPASATGVGSFEPGWPGAPATKQVHSNELRSPTQGRPTRTHIHSAAEQVRRF